MKIESSNRFSTWQELREALIAQLKSMCYSQGGVAQYQTIFNEIEQYLGRNGLNSYSKRVGLDFYNYMKQHPMGKVSMSRIPTVLRRLSDLLEGKKYTYLRPAAERQAPDCFKALPSEIMTNKSKNNPGIKQ